MHAIEHQLLAVNGIQLSLLQLRSAGRPAGSGCCTAFRVLAELAQATAGTGRGRIPGIGGAGDARRGRSSGAYAASRIMTR